jgi:hypothetical protein
MMCTASILAEGNTFFPQMKLMQNFAIQTLHSVWLGILVVSSIAILDGLNLIMHI